MSPQQLEGSTYVMEEDDQVESSTELVDRSASARKYRF